MRTKIDKIIHPTQIYSFHKKRKLFFLPKSVLILINIGPFSYLYAFFLQKTADYWYMPTLGAFTLLLLLLFEITSSTCIASDNPYTVCVSFIHEWQDLQVKIESNFIYSQSFCQKSA